jgi:hypothetical protein
VPKLSDADLAGIIKQRVDKALGTFGDQIASDRATALKYYKGDPFGDEQEGRSQMVSRDVAEAVDSVLPALLAIFTAGDQIARWEPRQQEDEAKAKQATDYTNWIVLEQNSGFLTFHHWFKDALIYKIGVVQACWDETDEITTEEYYGINEDELAILTDDDEVEITEQTQRMVLPALDGTMLQLSGAPENVGTAVYDVKLKRSVTDGQVRIEPVPPEEFLIERLAVSDTDTYTKRLPGIGRRRKLTVSELVEMGYDYDRVLEASTSEEDLSESSPERSERLSDQSDIGEEQSADEASREVVYTEWFDTIDVDGDGIAERRKFCMVGDSQFDILDNEECDYGHPYAALCPYPMPHKFHGESLADKTMDIQRWKSTLVRQANDNLYLSNTPRMVAIGNVNIDDLLNTRIGAIIRAQQGAQVVPVAVPFTAKSAFEMLEYADHVRGQRTGITQYSQGLDADSLNKTATGISMIQTAAMQRQELIARVFAETGVKRLFWLVLHLVTKYQQKEKIIKLRGEYVTMDPREWSNKMDLGVSVGIGTGNKQTQTAQMMQLLQMDLEIVKMQGGINGPLVTGENIYHTLDKLLLAMGQKSAAGFYTDPKNAPPQQPRPDPEIEKAKALVQIKAQESQQSAQLEQSKAQSQMQLAMAQAQQEMALERERAQHEFMLEEMRLQNELKIARLKATADIQIKGFTAAANAEIRASQPKPEANA